MMDQKFSKLMENSKVESNLPVGKDEAEHFASEVLKQAAKISHRKKTNNFALFMKSFFFGFLLFSLLVFFFLTVIYLKSMSIHN